MTKRNPNRMKKIMNCLEYKKPSYIKDDCIYCEYYYEKSSEHSEDCRKIKWYHEKCEFKRK